MEQSLSWQANSRSASQDISRLLLNLKVNCRVYKRPPLVSVLSQMNPVHTFLPCFSKIHSNIIFPSIFTSSEWSLPLRFSNQNIVRVPLLSHTCYMSTHLIQVSLIFYTITTRQDRQDDLQWNIHIHIHIHTFLKYTLRFYLNQRWYSFNTNKSPTLQSWFI